MIEEHDGWRSAWGGRQWKPVPGGVCYRDEPHSSGVIPRTRGEPISMGRYLEHWGDHIRAATEETKVPERILLATLGAENGPARVEGGRIAYAPVREEPGYVSEEETPHRISVGPCHLLISTARELVGPEVDREWLLSPRNNLLAAALMIRSQWGRTQGDPPLVAAAYNAGGIYRAKGRFANPWRLRCWVHGDGSDHVTGWLAWYGDAVAVTVGGNAGEEDIDPTDSRYLPRVVPPRVPERELRRAIYGWVGATRSARS